MFSQRIVLLFSSYRIVNTPASVAKTSQFMLHREIIVSSFQMYTEHINVRYVQSVELECSTWWHTK